MPIYMWECNKCRKKVDVLRPFAESDVPPDKGTMEVRDDCEHSWAKIIGGRQTVIKGANWGPGKGNWGRG